jgi:hypothetical protein
MTPFTTAGSDEPISCVFPRTTWLTSMVLEDATQDDCGLINHVITLIGRPIKLETALKRVDRQGPSIEAVPLLDVESFGDIVMVVAPRVWDVIEAFEPGIHQAFPVPVYVNGVPEADYLLVIWCQRAATLSRTYSFLPLTPGGDFRDSPWPKNKNDRVVHDKALVGYLHLWFEKPIENSCAQTP